MKTILLTSILLISIKGFCQPGCTEPYSGNFLTITYNERDRAFKSLDKGQFMKYDTLKIDDKSQCSCQILEFIELNIKDTIKLELLTDKGIINIYFLNNNVLSNEIPSRFIIFGLPKIKGNYYVKLKRNRKIDFHMGCRYDITPDHWMKN